MRSRSLCLTVLLLAQSASADDPAQRGLESEQRGAAELSATFSIVAVDPDSDVCGAAVASKYPAVGKVVPYVRAGVGAFCTQHYHEPKYGPRALDLLEQGKLPEAVLAELLTDDSQRDQRQLAIIDIRGRAANRNPAAAAGDSLYWGAVLALVASYIALVFGVHGGPALPAALIDGPLILLYPRDDRGYLIVVLAGGAALYGAYGRLVVRPPRFLRRWAAVTIIALIHVSAAALLLCLR